MGYSEEGPVERPEPADIPDRRDRRHNGHSMPGAPEADDGRSRKQGRVIKALANAEVARSWADQPDACLAEGMFLVVADLLNLASADAGAPYLKFDGMGARIDYAVLAKHLWLTNRENLPYSAFEEMCRLIQKYVDDLRQRCREMVQEEEARVTTYLEDIQTLYNKLHRLATPVAGSSHLSLPQKLNPEVYKEILNVVRGAVGRVLPREYGEGITDADVDQVEDLLLQLGTELQHQWSDSPAARGLVAEDLKRLLKELDEYDPSTPASDFVLLNSGARLLIELTGPKSFFGLFAQLNIYQVIDRLLPREHYFDAMQRLADDADALAQNRSVRDMVAQLNGDLQGGQEGLPNARRLCSYCLGNLVFAAIDTALAEGTTEETRKHLLARAKVAAGFISYKDSAFEQNAWYKLAIAAAEAELSGDESRFSAVVRNQGVGEACVLSEKIRKHVNRDVLFGAIDRHLLKHLRSAGYGSSPR